MQAKRYWIIGITIGGIYKPTLDRVSKKDIQSGEKVFTDYNKCWTACQEMQKVRDKKDADSKE